MTVPTGLANQDTMYVNNSGTWVEFPYFDYFKLKKKQNQMHEFEVQLYDISTAQKAYFKEFSEVLFFCGTTMVLKGRIQSIEYKSAYEVVAKGYGMEVLLSDKQFIVDGENRIQYDNTSAQTIFGVINGDILTTQSSGIFADDFGNISMRYEYANRLNAIGKTTEPINYFWWVTQTSSDTFSANYLNIDSNQGSTSSVKTFDLSNTAEAIGQEKDITNLVNMVYALGYGDGENQLSTYVYAASTQSSFLSANISATDSTISCSSITDFDASGSVRIAKEVIPYLGKDTANSTLTGCTRLGNAKAHNKLCYVEQHFDTSSTQTGSSIQKYGLFDYTLIDKTIINEETLEIIASGYLTDRKNPIVNIKVKSDEALTDATLNIGDTVTITSSEANIDGTYRIVGQEFEDNYGMLSLTTEVSNKTLEFVEQMKKSREEQNNLATYMQGATNIYAIAESENLDSNHPLDLTFYVPNEAIAINDVKLNFRQKGWRGYEDYQIQEETLNDPNTVIAIGEVDNETYINVSASGNPTSITTSTLTDTTSNWTTNSYQNFVCKCEDQLKMIDSNSSDTLYLRTAWGTIPPTSSQYLVIKPYTSSQQDIDITNEIDSIGRGKWANIQFLNAGGIESYDEPDFLIDGDLWTYTASATSSRITSSYITESDTYIQGAFFINDTAGTASFNLGVTSSALPALTNLAELSWRVQRGAQIPQDDDDGALVFNTDSKSYGNLTLGVDYATSSNTLYLLPDREYNFSSFTIGSGTTVKLTSSAVTGSVLYIRVTGSATIAGTISIDGANNSFYGGNSGTSSFKSISGVGSAAGGSGGKGGDGQVPTYPCYGGSGGAQSNGHGGGGGGGCAGYTTDGNGGNGGTGGLTPSGGAGGYWGSSSFGGDTGDAGSQSGGGGGGAFYNWGQGGNGGGSHSSGGGGGSGSNGTGGGGGGAGGSGGKQGCHFYIYADSITFTGTINTSGGNGGNGGQGGGGYDGNNHPCGGGGGAGGGGGGHAGNIRMYYVTSFDDTGKTATLNGGSAGSGASGGASNSAWGSAGSSGNSGTAGSNGTYETFQLSIGFTAGQGTMYVFGQLYNYLDDDSEFKIKKQPNDDWIFYDDLVPIDTFSAANNKIGVGMTGSYTKSDAINYDFKLYDLQIGGRGRMRIEANAYIKAFIQS